MGAERKIGAPPWRHPDAPRPYPGPVRQLISTTFGPTGRTLAAHAPPLSTGRGHPPAWAPTQLLGRSAPPRRPPPAGPGVGLLGQLAKGRSEQQPLPVV